MRVIPSYSGEILYHAFSGFAIGKNKKAEGISKAPFAAGKS
jgi:hypothetical protein